LYTTAFYRLLKRHVSRGGLIVVQSTSPLFARQSYWCIAETMKQAGFEVSPYHVYVPSFGEWGYVIGAIDHYQPPTTIPGGLRFLTAKDVPQMFQFPLDMQEVAVTPNRLNDQILVRYYDTEWKSIAR
jgi:spermidine synthase